MANILDGLIAKIDDNAMRNAIATEAARLRDTRDFGRPREPDHGLPVPDGRARGRGGHVAAEFAPGGLRVRRDHSG
jgi:hypothetical protein